MFFSRMQYKDNNSASTRNGEKARQRLNGCLSMLMYMQPAQI